MIRQATTTDFIELAELYHDASLIHHPFIDPDYTAMTRQELKNRELPLAEASVYQRGGEILGFIAMARNHINGLFVSAQHQRIGIGSELVQHVKDRHQTLKLRCFAENYRVQRFYHAQGFEITEERSPPEATREEYIMQWPNYC